MSSRIVGFINISLIKMDHHPLNPSVLGLIDHLDSGGSVPPIKVASLKDGTFLIRDGRHRVTASKLLGWKTIKAKYSTRIYDNSLF